MRGLGAVFATIALLALPAGCGGEDGPIDERSAPPRGAASIAGAARPAAQAREAAPAVAQDATAPKPAPAPEPPTAADTGAAGAPLEPGAIELVETDGVGLAELVIARGVSERKPVDPGQEFSLADGPKLYAVLLVSNPAREESELTVSWKRGADGQELGGVTLEVGAQPRWRTWAYHSYFKRPGSYSAIVRNAQGEVIGRAPFVLTD
jgi:hypothetical protein